MSRYTPAERRARREVYDELARRGEEWLRVGEDELYLDLGFSSWEQYLAIRAEARVAKTMQLTKEQARQLVLEGLRLARARRRGGRRGGR